MKGKHMLVSSILQSMRRDRESFGEVIERTLDDNEVLLRIYSRTKHSFASIKDLKKYIKTL